MKFEPLMTLYLTDNTSAEEIRKAKASGIVHAVKLYPAGATTNSDAGVTDLRKTYAALEEMQRCGMPLLVHGEVTNADIDIFDREAVFIERVMQPLLKDLPEPARGVRAHHHQGCRAVRDRARRTPSPPRSPRNTCCTTATPCWSAASARTSTACRF